MKWVLLFIGLSGEEILVGHVETYNTMDACFEEREQIIETVGRPIINYQAICIAKVEDTK